MPHFVVANGCRLRYQIDGPDGAPVLLFSNSLGSDLSMWQAQIPALSGRYRVVRYDSRGHGSSDVPAGPYTIEDLGKDAVGVLDALEIDRADFCGLSLGGMVGMWLGVNVPHRIGRLILANTSAKLGPPSMWDDRIRMVQSLGMAGVTDIVLDRWFTPAFRSSTPAVVEACREMLLATPIDGYVSACAAIRDMDQTETVKTIDNPTQVIIGQNDPSTPPAHGQFIASRIAWAQTVVLPAAHLSNIETSSAFNDAVLNFLND